MHSKSQLIFRLITFALAAALTQAAQARSAEAQTFSVIHTFTGPEGGEPGTGLTMNAMGDFYGTTVMGGTYNFGTVFKLKHSGSGWGVVPLYSFAGGSDGAEPGGEIAIAADGSLFGTTVAGGQGSCLEGGCGTIFRLTPPPSSESPWNETVLHRFTGGSDGAWPQGNLTFGASGNLYGTAIYGGNLGFSRCASVGNILGCGVVYELAPSGGAWVETVIYSPHEREIGFQPIGGLVMDRSGNLYGALSNGDPSGGAVFELTPSGSGWTVQILFDQFGYSGYPESGLIMDGSGNLYGSTWGMVFELTPSQGSWNLTQLFGSNGGYPIDRLAMDAGGNLYGTTFYGGAYGQGAIFKLTPSGDGTWTYSSLHDFTCGTDGCLPASTVVFDADGNLYGTASYGATPCDGSYGCGVIWEITP